MRSLCFFVMILSLAGILGADPGKTGKIRSAPEPGRTGHFTVRFDHHDPRSSVEVANRRLGKSGTFPPEDYVFDLTEESYQVYVPESYDESKPFGLIAWISSGPNGGVPQPYVELMDKHRLIWIGANDAGNSRQPHWIRAMLAIDAVFNMHKLYRIDPRRIYVSGISGGGRVSSMVAPPYPDVFTGGACYIVGCNPIRHIPIGDNRAFPGFWHQPDPDLISISRKRRYVMLTGSDDYNRPGTKRVFEAYKEDGFPHVSYLEEPELGHALPSLEWFEKAILFLDAPVRRAKEKARPPTPRPKDPDARELRTWTSGKHTTRARLIELKDGIAVLKRSTGETMRVPYEKLSSSDREYLDKLKIKDGKP